MSRTATRLILLVSLACPFAAQGQTAPAPDLKDEIVVLGTGLDLPPGTPAYGSTVIDRGRLANDASGRVEDVLADVAGFQQFRRSDSRSANPSAQGATLRALGGNASSRTLVLLDGVPIADPFFGYIPFNALVPDRLSGIRVTRGGGSRAFGSGAVAGEDGWVEVQFRLRGRSSWPAPGGATCPSLAVTPFTATVIRKASRAVCRQAQAAGLQRSPANSSAATGSRPRQPASASLPPRRRAIATGRSALVRRLL